jgi:signal transduction histidine kinase
VSVARQQGATGAFAVLTVQDQGLGIPAPDLPRVFERFHRGGNVAGRIPGTGVGLAAAQHIVQQHGGTITVESTEGAGATFTMRLPLAAGESGRQEPIAAAAAVP